MVLDPFWSTTAIEVIFISTYRTAAKIDRESAGKIIFFISGIRYTYFRVSLCFDVIVPLYVVIVVSVCDDCWNYIHTVWSCGGGGGAHCDISAFGGYYLNFVDMIYSDQITSYLSLNVCRNLHCFVLVVDIIFGHIKSYLARNICPISHIYWSSEIDWHIRPKWKKLFTDGFFSYT